MLLGRREDVEDPAPDGELASAPDAVTRLCRPGLHVQAEFASRDCPVNIKDQGGCLAGGRRIRAWQSSQTI